MKFISALLSISSIIYSVKGFAFNSSVNVELSKKSEEAIPNDPNIYVKVFSPAVDSDVPTWSKNKSHVIKFYSWLNNPEIKSPNYGIDNLKVVATNSNKDNVICDNIKVEYGELECEWSSNKVEAGLWEISIIPSNHKSWVLASFNLNIVEDGEDKFDEFLVPVTTHYVADGTPFYITSPISSDKKIEQYTSKDTISIKWSAFELTGYAPLKDTSVALKVAKYQPPIRYMENRLKWTTLADNIKVDKNIYTYELNPSKLNSSGNYWVRVYEGNNAVAQTFFELVDSKTNVANTESALSDNSDGVMLHIISPTIDNEGNFMDWNVHSNDKKEIKWKLISGDRTIAIDVYAVLPDKNGKILEKHRVCSEIEVSAESCLFNINKFTTGVWKLYIENIENNSVYEKTFVEITSSSSVKVSEADVENSKDKTSEILSEPQYISGERSPYTIALNNIKNEWNIKEDNVINWRPTSANSLGHDYPTMSVFAQQGKKNITICDNIEISEKTCTVKADTLQENGNWMIVWMKDGLIINRKTITATGSDSKSTDNESNGSTNGRMLMESLTEDKIKVYATYTSVSNEGYAQWKKDASQKITWEKSQIQPYPLISKADDSDSNYNIICEFKDAEECIFNLPDEVKRGEVNSHWVFEITNSDGRVVSRLPIRLIE